MSILWHALSGVKVIKCKINWLRALQFATNSMSYTCQTHPLHSPGLYTLCRCTCTHTSTHASTSPMSCLYTLHDYDYHMKLDNVRTCPCTHSSLCKFVSNKLVFLQIVSIPELTYSIPRADQLNSITFRALNFSKAFRRTRGMCGVKLGVRKWGKS